MTFKQAKKKLKKIANGRYHSLKYDLSEFSNGNLEAECTVYIGTIGMHSAPSWDAAFALLENDKPDPKEAP